MAEGSRRDKLGRRIGYNWWREYIVGLWFSADQAWQLTCEQVAIGYETEEREYANEHPRPTLKEFMIALAEPERYYKESA